MLTRRQCLKNGLVVASSVSLVSVGRRADADVTLPGQRLAPWADELRPDLLQVHTPVSSLAGFNPTDRSQLKEVHQHYDFQVDDEDTAPLLYEVNIVEGEHRFHRDLPPTRIWRYTRSGGDQAGKAQYPGPSFRFTQITRGTIGKTVGLGTLYEARPVLVRFYNRLPADHVGFGDTTCTVHHHGAHVAARSDGFPVPLEEMCQELKDLFLPYPPGGGFGPTEHFDYYYPMRLAEFSTSPDRIGEADDVASTRWYHDHPVDFTGSNVYKGLAGLALAYDEYEPDDETGTFFTPFVQGGTNLQLPSGAFDIPLLLQDKTFDAQGQLIFNPFEHDGFLGNQFMVNGKIQPFLRVHRRKYRFRVLNGSNARVYQMFLSKGANSRTLYEFYWVGNEGGIFTTPIRTTNFRLPMAERAEVIIDFGHPQFNGVSEVYFENRLEQTDGRRPDGIGKGTPMLQFRLSNERPHDPSRLPPDLQADPLTAPRAKAAVPDAELADAARRVFEFDRRHGSWAINGELFDHCNKPAVEIPLGATQRWRLVNKSGGWVHPVHIHLEYMHILSRNGRRPARALDERDGNALKDTIYLGPNEEVEMAMRFRDFTGPYVFHCHNIEHEDGFMMAIFNVVRSPARPS
jgi:FtsP/CotA-like multicopper oxidase with cupredoxin domain